MTDRNAQALSFGAGAHDYQQGRPEYPADAVRWLLEPAPEPRRVADVGAGTGKLTSALQQAGAGSVTAVEPDGQMLRELSKVLPDLPSVQGTAEALPLPDGSVDAVVMGQAWHWVDPVVASQDIGRVLSPHGVLGVVWNVRDTRELWVQRFVDAMEPSAAERMVLADDAGEPQGGVHILAPFSVVEKTEWSWKRVVTRELLLANARSRSPFLTATPDAQERMLGAVQEFCDEQGLVGDAEREMPYRTVAFRAVKPF